MSYTWFKIFNKDEFEALDIPSKQYEMELQDKGLKTILVTKGNLISVLIDDVLLSLNLNDKNPFEFEGMALYLKSNGDVFVGYEVSE